MFEPLPRVIGSAAMRPTDSPRLPILALVLATAACGNDGISDSPPAAPEANGPAFVVHMKQWHLMGDGVTPDGSSVGMVVDAPEGASTVELWSDQLIPIRLARGG